ncbi:MAG: DNA recombination protein RmuC [Candidatus Kerfeldbacteria bacterium]|nr:DNA recombination protein RmuC [Candidatus Kerfeldbacteria bacterium]
METVLIIAIIVLAVGVVVLAVRRKPTAVQQDPQVLQLLKTDLEALKQQMTQQQQNVNQTLTNHQQHVTQTIQQQFGQSTKIIQEVTEKLTKLDETNKQVVTFADQLQKLQDILKNPKQRGILGEYFLDQLLKQAFQPQQYELQYKFRDGQIVDAALFFGDKIIPIDAKFSLENYNRIVEESDPAERQRLEQLFKQDLKHRIDETAKYVRPDEGTMEFAFMFIPAEGIFYDLLVNKVGAVKVNTRDLIDYAVREKHVHIVSPTTFYVTLQSLAVGMNAYKIQESTKQILQNVSMLGRHLKAYDDYFKRLGSNLTTTVNAYNLASKELGKVDKDVVKLTGNGTGIEPTLLEKPHLNEE